MAPHGRALRRRSVLAGLAGLGFAGLLPSCGDEVARAYPGDPLPLDWIVVRLTADPLELSADGAWEQLDPSGEVRGSGDAGPIPVTHDEAGLRVADSATTEFAVDVRGVGSTALSLGSRAYRGVLRLQRLTSGALGVFNRLHVDDYLRGVVPGEMPDRFGLAALCAQTVAARTYALAEMRARGWLHADVRSQVYGGRPMETWLGDRAVAETRGQVLTVDGQVFPAWFHSTCGGSTVPARDVFPAAPAGVLRTSRPCSACDGSPTWAWTRTVPAARVCAAVGLPTAALSSVQATPDEWPGRPRSLRIVAGGRSAEVSADHFRRDASAGQPFEQRLLSTHWARAATVRPDALVVHGRGWGHGVGLCQYGAAGRARAGAGYADILAHYYDGARLVRLADAS